ncbi:MAG: helix-turn-helix transcriptional regulator [Synergistaceae bacterium]
MSLGNKIKELRKKAGIYNQEELAFRLGTARQTVSSWERGMFLPDSKNLKKLAEELNTTVSYLLGEDDCELECEDYSSSSFEKRSFPESEGVTEYQLGMRCSDGGEDYIVIRKMKCGKAVQYELSGREVDLLKDMVEDLWRHAERFARD